jgi:hypothetical protein
MSGAVFVRPIGGGPGRGRGGDLALALREKGLARRLMPPLGRPATVI